MTLSERTSALLLQYLTSIEDEALNYRNEVIKNTKPELIEEKLPLFLTTAHPDTLLLPYKQQKGFYPWRHLMVYSFLPTKEWFRNRDQEPRTELIASIRNDLSFLNEEIEHYNLEECLSQTIETYIIEAAKTYLAIITHYGSNTQERALNITIKRLIESINPGFCHRYISSYVYNLQLESPSSKVVIDEGIEIRPSTLSDIAQQAPYGSESNSFEGEYLPPAFLIAIKDKVDAISCITDSLGFNDTCADQIEDVITALRLHQHQYVGRGNIISWNTNLTRSRSFRQERVDSNVILLRTSLPPELPPYILKETDYDSVRSIYHLLRNSPVKEKLRIALSRFNASYQRNDAHERIIDLIVVLESLFGEETVGQSTEVGYRLRMRAARYLGDNLTDRRRIKDFISRVYEVRSKIIHGSARDAENLSQRRFGKPAIDVLYDIEGYARKAIKKILAHPSHIGSDFLNDLLLSDTESII